MFFLRSRFWRCLISLLVTRSQSFWRLPLLPSRALPLYWSSRSAPAQSRIAWSASPQLLFPIQKSSTGRNLSTFRGNNIPPASWSGSQFLAWRACDVKEPFIFQQSNLRLSSFLNILFGCCCNCRPVGLWEILNCLLMCSFWERIQSVWGRVLFKSSFDWNLRAFLLFSRKKSQIRWLHSYQGICRSNTIHDCWGWRCARGLKSLFLLVFCLQRIWDRWGGRTISKAMYFFIDGIGRRFVEIERQSLWPIPIHGGFSVLEFGFAWYFILLALYLAYLLPTFRLQETVHEKRTLSLILRMLIRRVYKTFCWLMHQIINNY